MKQGKDIKTLATEIQRQANAKRDFVVPVANMQMLDNATLHLGMNVNSDGGGFAIQQTAHQQIGEYAGIPGMFYDRIRSSHPALLAHNVNTLIHAQPANAKRLTRTLDGNVRAFLSDKYRPLDNVDLMTALLPHLLERKDIQWASAEVTDRRLYIKLIAMELEGEVRPGEVVRFGTIIQNSEIGLGSMIIAPFSEVLRCTNGMTHVSLGQRRAHLGRALDSDSDMLYFADETRKADDVAFFLKARDTLNAALDGKVVGRILDDMRAAADEKIESGKAIETMEAVAVQVGLDASEKAAALDHLINGADLSRWGIANAITRTAQDAATYDRASDLEKIGGDLIHTTTLTEIKPIKVRATRTSKTTRRAEPVAV